MMNIIFSFKWLNYLETKTLIDFNCSLIGPLDGFLKLHVIQISNYFLNLLFGCTTNVNELQTDVPFRCTTNEETHGRNFLMLLSFSEVRSYLKK